MLLQHCAMLKKTSRNIRDEPAIADKARRGKPLMLFGLQAFWAVCLSWTLSDRHIVSARIRVRPWKPSPQSWLVKIRQRCPHAGACVRKPQLGASRPDGGLAALKRHRLLNALLRPPVIEAADSELNQLCWLAEADIRKGWKLLRQASLPHCLTYLAMCLGRCRKICSSRFETRNRGWISRNQVMACCAACSRPATALLIANTRRAGGQFDHKYSEHSAQADASSKFSRRKYPSAIALCARCIARLRCSIASSQSPRIDPKPPAPLPSHGKICVQ
jgi:hypothetical protein